MCIWYKIDIYMFILILIEAIVAFANVLLVVPALYFIQLPVCYLNCRHMQKPENSKVLYILR